MTTPRDDAAAEPPRHPNGGGRPETPTPAHRIRLVDLRLEARVVSADEEVLLVGSGSGVEISADGVTTLRAHNEPVRLRLADVAGAHRDRARGLLVRCRALDEPVRVRLTVVRGGPTTAPRPLPEVLLELADGTEVGHWRAASALDAPREPTS